LAGHNNDGKSKGTPCKMHSYPGCPAKHEWAECSENPANQKKPGAKRTEAYYAHNERCPASDAASLSDHRTALVSNSHSKRYSSHSVYSDKEDNFAVGILALPRKKAKCKVLPPKRKLTIAMSESDEDADDNVASAKLGKLAALYATTPSVRKKHHRTKGAKCNPLHLSDSN
jgi:hypothetical protein